MVMNLVNMDLGWLNYMNIQYKKNTTTEQQIFEYLKKNEVELSLTGLVDIFEYSKKIYEKAIKFEAFIDDELIGLVAVYDSGFLTSVGVLKKFKFKGIGSHLLTMGLDFLRKNRCLESTLKVHTDNNVAINFYKKFGFIEDGIDGNYYKMRLNMERDYNKELEDTENHKYAYNFDFDVMHSFMIKSFIPFFIKGNLLELGSYKGDFTKRLFPYFNDITCIEASSDAVEIAKKEIGNKVRIKNSLFEDTFIIEKFDNIVCTHVLEHLDDPVSVLKQINNEWLSDNGRLFLVCPNANAASRQIAVLMGLISNNSAITKDEEAHGHKITYSLDTLERDVRLSGLNIIHRSGIFFKALANFQWDKLMEHNIVTSEYLEGCYKLGMKYPELCSSIFLVCDRGVNKWLN
jgi:2-polyprenyl-3-methyl-5-hydroxy-6-metoxy-1,4-benzoquinol methylase